MQKLIILRGNSGSGKSTTATKLRHEMGYETMLIPQDVVRREVLRTRDGLENPSIQLIYDLAMYGNKIGYNVIVEGILASKWYGEMLRNLINDFNGQPHIYYFDIPIEETLRRHSLKPNSQEFGEKEMRSWWMDEDHLNVPNEKNITVDMSQKDIVSMIVADMNTKRQ